MRIRLPNCSMQTEILAGITTFLTMVYIAFVNPAILHDAGMDQGAVFTATCLVTAFACALTGVMANTPIAVAPGMALNIYFTYSVVQSMGIDWQHALAMVFVSGVLFFIVSLTRLRRLLIESIPQSLLFFAGFLLILALDYYRVRGAIIISILSISTLSLLLGLTSWHGLVSTPPSMKATFLQLDFSNMTTATSLKATFTFFLIAVFDATGTLIGLLNQSMFKDQPKYTERLSNSLTADAAASALAGLLGSASTSPYIESAAGIEAGGRTGITTMVVALGFLLMLFFFPLAQAIPTFAVGPALLYVACCMMKHVGELTLPDITETAPCMLTIMMIPFTSSIADGIGSGIILYALLKLLSRQKINPLLLILTMVFVVFFFVS